MLNGDAIVTAHGRPLARPSVLPRLELAGLACLALLPLVLEPFGTALVTRILILAILAVSFDLVWGYAGILSFGQALFFGAGAYAVALLGRDLDLAQGWLTLPAAALSGGILAALVGWFLLLGRRPPSLVFVAIGTLAGSYAAERLVNASLYLGGRNGISGVPPIRLGPVELFEGVGFYFLAFGTLAFVYLACRLLVRSQLGLVLAGVRDAERRLLFLGYRVARLKALVFGLSGAVAGLAGGLHAYHEGYVGPTGLGIELSTMVVLYVLLGGSGTLVGAVLGVIAIESLGHFLSDFSPRYWSMALGLLLLAVVVFRPSGLLGLVVSDRERVGRFGVPMPEER